MQAIAVIPARFGSTRLPGKPLLDRTGQPLVVHVAERAAAAASIDSVIVATDYDGGGVLAALDQETGEEIWREPRPGKTSYSSPIVAPVAGRHQLLISGCDLVVSRHPETGNLLWKTEATTMATCGTMVRDEGIVFVSGGYPDKETVGIRADGSGEVVWQNNQKCYEQSMLAVDGHVYATTDQCIVYCWRASDGKMMWRERLGGGKISASPTFANGNIYQVDERGRMFVFKASPDSFQKVSENQLGTEAFASPSICGDRIFLRIADSSSGERREFLYGIGAD